MQVEYHGGPVAQPLRPVDAYWEVAIGPGNHPFGYLRHLGGEVLPTGAEGPVTLPEFLDIDGAIGIPPIGDDIQQWLQVGSDGHGIPPGLGVSKVGQ
jgi:hypothetical protein